MPEGDAALLAGLTRELRHWLACQQRLGLKVAPERLRVMEAVAAPPPEAKAAVDAEASPAAPAPPPTLALPTLEAVQAELGDCRRCKLAAGRTHIVFGKGNARARLMFIGEGPGAEEDLQGVPFVGAAGQLLDRILAKMELDLSQVYIANIVKCRPPGNRDPEPDEIAACRPFLLKQIEAIRPRVIVTLGKVATQALLETTAPISRLRGQWQLWRGLKVMPTFHPSYLLRAPRERIKTWEDMQPVMAAIRD